MSNKTGPKAVKPPAPSRPKKPVIAKDDVSSINALVKKRAVDMSMDMLENLYKVAMTAAKDADKIKASETVLFFAGGRPTAGNDVRMPTNNSAPHFTIIFGTDAPPTIQAQAISYAVPKITN